MEQELRSPLDFVGIYFHFPKVNHSCIIARVLGSGNGQAQIESAAQFTVQFVSDLPAPPAG